MIDFFYEVCLAKWVCIQWRIQTFTSGGRGVGLTMNVEFCKDNSGRSKKVGGRRPPLDPPLVIYRFRQA